MDRPAAGGRARGRQRRRRRRRARASLDARHSPAASGLMPASPVVSRRELSPPVASSREHPTLEPAQSHGGMAPPIASRTRIVHVDTEPAGAQASHSTSPPPSRGRSSPTPSWSDSELVGGSERTVLYTWGANTNGQLGLGDLFARIVPSAVPYFKTANLVDVVCGSRLALALDHEGRVFTWGKGEDGTLGIGERGTVMKPRLVEALMRHPISAMACRGAHGALRFQTWLRAVRCAQASRFESS